MPLLDEFLIAESLGNNGGFFCQFLIWIKKGKIRFSKIQKLRDEQQRIGSDCIMERPI
jgi:hypothetical protein